MYDKLIISGYAGGDPELRYSSQGQTVCNFSVATNRRWTNQEGESIEETLWIRVSVWGRQAEICHQYLTKGRLVLVEGHLKPDKETGGPRVWIGQDGNARASYELTAQEVKFLDGKPPETNGRRDDEVDLDSDANEEEISF